MKNETSRSASQPKPLPARHQFDHEVPTHIHNPEEDMMLLARWTHRAMQNPTLFWGTIAAIVAVALGIVLAEQPLPRIELGASRPVVEARAGEVSG